MYSEAELVPPPTKVPNQLVPVIVVHARFAELSSVLTKSLLALFSLNGVTSVETGLDGPWGRTKQAPSTMPTETCAQVPRLSSKFHRESCPPRAGPLNPMTRTNPETMGVIELG
jgi:hypothetical protein